MIRVFQISLIILFSVPWPALCQQKIEKEISYTSDLAFNLSGGTRTGYAWMGCFQASALLDLEKLNLWENGKLKFSYISTHGKSFSELTGDIQIASNIEAGSLATTLEFWYQHQLGKMNITAGFIDLNAFFSYSDLALPLLNSSFGIQPTISGNMPVPIFPITSLGSVVNINLKNENELNFGIFDGNPAHRHDYNVMPDITWNNSEGILMVAEYIRPHLIGLKEGVLKAGFWTHTLQMPSHKQGKYDANFGFYFIGEQEIIRNNAKSLQIWGKFGGAPNDCNIIRFFNGAGLTYSNFLGKSINDVISFGYGQAIFCSEFRTIHSLSWHETVLELTVRKELGVFTIQPDFQYIIHPSGATEITNPYCLILRTSITL